MFNKGNIPLVASVLLAIAASGTAFYIWHPILDSWWYITDDYRWPTILGPDRTLTFAEFIQNCNPPDWHLGSKVNRPSYYFTTSLLMYCFGDSIVWWNATRIAMMSFALGATTWVVARMSGPIAAVSFILLGFHSLWLDALPRLQSELFAAFGLAMLALSLWCLNATLGSSHFRRFRAFFLFTTTAAALYSAGSKENTTVLIAALSGVAFSASFITQAGLVRAVRFPAFLALVWSAILLLFIRNGLSSSGTDLYGRPLFSDETLSFFLGGVIDTPWFFALSLASLFALLLLRLSRTVAQSAALRNAVVSNAVGQLLLLGYSGFLVVFYRGEIPTITCRYQFPYVYLPYIGVAFFLFQFRRAAPVRSIVTATVCMLIGAALAVSAHFSVVRAGSYLSNIDGARRYTDATNRFQTRILELVYAAQGSPSSPIEFCSFGFNDFEPLASVDLFLKANGCQNPIYLSISGYSEETVSNPSERYLLQLTRGFYTSGRFLRPEEMPADPPPIRANFSREDLSNGAVANYWPLW